MLASSPYLNRPVRTLEEAQRDLAAARAGRKPVEPTASKAA